MPGPLYRPTGGPSLLHRRPWGALSASPTVGLPPVVLQIPYSWIATPETRQPTSAITKAQITQQDGATAYASASDALVRQYGANTARTTLDTAVDADAQNLASFLVAYEAVPRPRRPTLTFQLLNRTDAECLLLLGATLAQRAQIIQAPSGIPPGLLDFTIEGISHVGAVDNRSVTWATAALIGATTTAPGPWFRFGTSVGGSSDTVPF